MNSDVSAIVQSLYGEVVVEHIDSRFRNKGYMCPHLLPRDDISATLKEIPVRLSAYAVGGKTIGYLGQCSECKKVSDN